MPAPLPAAHRLGAVVVTTALAIGWITLPAYAQTVDPVQPTTAQDETAPGAGALSDTPLDPTAPETALEPTEPSVPSDPSTTDETAPLVAPEATAPAADDAPAAPTDASPSAPTAPEAPADATDPAPGDAPAPGTDPTDVPVLPAAGDDEVTTWLVEVDPAHDPVPAELATEDITAVHEYEDALQGYAVEATEDQIEALADVEGVLSVEPDLPVSIDESSTQDRAPWGLDRVDQATLPLDGRFTYPRTAGSGVRVYVVDTGVERTHTEFGGRVTAGFNALPDGVATADCNGHGTHVAGTVASRTYGVAKSATIVPVRVLKCGGSGSVSDVIRGLDWIVANHPKGTPGVINMSLGGGTSSALTRAVEAATASGLLVVVAAGNSNTDACLSSPASAPSALTVAATTMTDTRATFSSWGRCVDGFAPGARIVSTIPGNGTGTKSGTSMAAPHAAGLAALLLSDTRTLTPSQVTERLEANSGRGVKDAGPGSPNRIFGIGSTPSTTRPGATAPGVPTKIVASKVATTAATVSWTAPAGTAPTGYSVQHSTNGTTWSKAVTVTNRSVRLTGLKASTTYTVRVKALAGSATSAWAKASIKTAPRPSAVRSLKVTSRAPSTVGLSWGVPATSAALVVDYKIETSRDGKTWSTYADGVSTKTTTTVRKLAPGVAYTFRVTAVADGKTTGAATTVRAKTLAAPSAPRSAKVTARAATTLSLSWQAPKTSGAQVTGYRVQVSRDKRTWTTVSNGSSSARTAKVTGLKKGTPYTVRVLAKSGTSWGTGYATLSTSTRK